MYKTFVRICPHFLGLMGVSLKVLACKKTTVSNIYILSIPTKFLGRQWYEEENET